MEPEFALEPIAGIGPVIVFVIVLAVVLASALGTILVVWAYCRIFSKAGFSWAMGLLMLVPLANVLVPFILAFSDWPIQREVRVLKGQS